MFFTVLFQLTCFSPYLQELPTHERSTHTHYIIYMTHILNIFCCQEKISTNTGISTGPAQAGIWVMIAFYIQTASSTLGFWTQQGTVLVTAMYGVNIKLNRHRHSMRSLPSQKYWETSLISLLDHSDWSLTNYFSELVIMVPIPKFAWK